MSKVTAKCPFCEQLFLMERPLFKGEREQTACPACANEARRNTERMLRLRGRLSFRARDAQQTMTEMHHHFVPDHKSGVMVCDVCGRGQPGSDLYPCRPGSNPPPPTQHKPPPPPNPTIISDEPTAEHWKSVIKEDAACYLQVLLADECERRARTLAKEGK